MSVTKFPKILSLLMMFLITTSFSFASNLKERFAKEIIDDIGKKYDVFFSYDNNLVDGVKVDFEFNDKENVRQTTKRFISKLDLSYEFFTEKYVVLFKDSKEAREDLEKLRKHFKEIEKIEAKGHLSIKKIDAFNTHEQESISGIVTSKDGESLPGANISVKGKAQSGTTTDIDGNFTLTTQLPATLIVSFVGYTTKEVTVTSSSQNLKIQLEEAAFSLDNVVVTARKRVENVQDTPISITAIQGVVLEEMGVNKLSGIGDIAPNLTFSTTGTVSGSSSAAVVYMRGIGQNDYVPVADPGVGIYVDEVYLGRTIGSVLDLADLKSIEVIRGPQGTLFGRNSIGGAIALTSTDPSEELEGKISFTGGSYARNDVSFRLAGPISESLGFTLNGIRRNRRGYVERVFVKDSYLGNDNSHGLRFKLNFQQPDSKFSAKFIVDYATEDEESAAEQNLYFHNDRLLPRLWNTNSPAAPTSTATGYDENSTTAGENIYDQRWNFGPFKTGETSLSENKINTWGVSTNLGYELGSSSDLKLILAYRDLKANFARQTDGTPLNIFENRDLYNQNQFSADFRYTLSTDKFDFVSGLFYFNEKVENILKFTGALQSFAYPVFVGGLVDNSNYAIYAEGTYKLTDELSVTGGLRYTNEIKRAQPNVYRDPSIDINGTPNVPDPIRDATNNPRRLIDKVWQENSFDQVTYRLNMAYKASDALNLYGTVSTGFKSGGFEWRVTNNNFYDDPLNDSDGDGDGDLPQFKPETVTSYEVGAKVKTGKIRFNTALFFTDYRDLQIAANPPGSIATFQTNAGNAEIKGLETELIWLPNTNAMINLGYGYTDAKYTDLIEGVTVSKDDNFILTPKHMLTFGASYRFPLSFGSLTPRLDGHYKSRIDFEAQNSDYVYDDGHTAMNASLKLKLKKNWEFIAAVENLTNALYLIGGDSNTAIGYENGIYARPRSYNFTVSYSF